MSRYIDRTGPCPAQPISTRLLVNFGVHRFDDHGYCRWCGVLLTGGNTEVAQINCMLLAIFAERCPGIRLDDRDLPHYRAAAIAALTALGVLEPPAAPTDPGPIAHSARCLNDCCITVKNRQRYYRDGTAVGDLPIERG